MNNAHLELRGSAFLRCMVAHLHRKHQEYQKIWIFGKKNFPPQFFAQAILLRAQTLDSGPIHDGHHESTASFARTPPYHVFSATKSPRIKIKFLPCESRYDADSALQLELRDTHTMYIPYLTQCSTSPNFGPKPRLRFWKLGTP